MESGLPPDSKILLHGVSRQSHGTHCSMRDIPASPCQFTLLLLTHDNSCVNQIQPQPSCQHERRHRNPQAAPGFENKPFSTVTLSVHSQARRASLLSTSSGPLLHTLQHTPSQLPLAPQDNMGQRNVVERWEFSMSVLIWELLSC